MRHLLHEVYHCYRNQFHNYCQDLIFYKPKSILCFYLSLSYDVLLREFSDVLQGLGQCSKEPLPVITDSSLKLSNVKY